MSILAEHGSVLLLIACFFAFFMAWGVGANDVANAMGTSVGSKALTIKQAIFIAIIFEFAGSYLAGGEVTATIRKGIIDPVAMSDTPHLLVYGMMASLLAAGLWLLIATAAGWPVSTTHTIVGAIIGFAVAGVSVDAVQWSVIGSIVASWVISPLMAGIISFWLFRSVQMLILDTEDPFTKAKKYVPVYMFLTAMIVSMMTMLDGLKHIGLNFSFFQCTLISIAVSIAVAGFGKYLLSRIKRNVDEEKEFRFYNVEKIFAVLMIFTACAMAFAHGSNDVANAVGPLAAIFSVIQSGGDIGQKSLMPPWILFLGGTGIVLGVATYGFRVIATIGKKITELTPSRGFAAELAAASTVVIASSTGLPISTTHTLVGAVLGVGFARGIAALNLRVIGAIFMSWVITLPAGAIFSIMFFFMLKGMFG